MDRSFFSHHRLAENSDSKPLHNNPNAADRRSSSPRQPAIWTAATGEWNGTDGRVRPGRPPSMWAIKPPALTDLHFTPVMRIERACCSEGLPKARGIG